MLFRDFVEEKVREAKHHPLVESPFGFNREGTCLNRWQMNLNLASMYARFGGVFFSSSNPVRIFVPSTDKGIIPLTEEEQPYGWSGKINPCLAEQAVWWAFEILTESEAGDFLRTEQPRVVFHYFEEGKERELTVRFIDEDWHVVE